MQNEIILSSLKSSGKVAAMASEEDDNPVWISDDGPFVVVTDPLDGSRNIDASIPTGSLQIYLSIIIFSKINQNALCKHQHIRLVLTLVGQ
jgi:fructose-1,6-bisphosphatase